MRYLLNKRRVRIFFVTALILIVITATISSIYFGQKEYKNEKFNFSFNHPKNWTEENLVELGLDKYLVVRLKETKSEAKFQVKVEETKGENKIIYSELEKDLDKTFQIEFEDFKKVSSKQIKINNIEAIEYNFTYVYKTESGNIKNAQQKMIIFAVQNKIYYLSGFAEIDKFVQIEKQIDKMINSFSIK